MTPPRLAFPLEGVIVFVDAAVCLVDNVSDEILENDAGIGTGMGTMLLSSCRLLFGVLLIAVDIEFKSLGNVPENNYMNGFDIFGGHS